MCIENLIIHNFQSHKKTSLEFDSGVNCIIGASDNGKSSILRALQWLITNKPSGDSFRSNWGGDTKVITKLNKFEIRRHKNKKENSYTSRMNGDMDQVHKAMGTDVPEEIKSILNMNDINIQKQMDSPFLLSSTAGETARYLNKIVQLDKIDTTLYNIESKKKKIKSNLDYKENDLKKQESELKNFKWLDNAEIKVKELEKLNSYFIKIKNKYSDLNTIIYNIQEIRDNQKEYDKVLKYEAQVNSCIELNEKIGDIFLEKERLNNIIIVIENINNKIYEYDEVIKYESKVKETNFLHLEWCGLKNDESDLSGLLYSIKKLEEELEVMSEDIEMRQEEYNKLFPEVCPLCLQTI